MSDGGAKRELATRIRELRLAAGYSQERLAAKLGFKRAYVSQAESGRDVPSENLIDALDVALDAGGELRTLRGRAWQERRVRRRSPPDPRQGRGEDTTDRRQVLQTSALAAASAFAADTYQRISTAEPGALTLAELEADVDEIAVVYTSVPHVALLPRVVDRWRQVEVILDSRTGGQTRQRVTVLGGQFAFFLGRMGFNTGDMRAARRFAMLSGHYADEAGEPVLAASVAALHSSIDYYTGRYTAALDHLRAADRWDHPYVRARMAAYEARVHAALGDADAARVALDRMEATAGDFRPVPGETPVGEAAVAMFRSGIAARLGDASTVEEWAPVAITAYQARNGDFSAEEEQHAVLNLAMARLLGPSPEPDTAATIGMQVLTTLAASHTHTVAERIRQLNALFTPTHRAIPAVRDFTDRLRQARPALPAGATS
ncbi:helix-turn-helix transcriptional regulator [Frankia sp. Cppng1_Ct_nod]|uniref:helix-turn-helix domain-containing protein n=1 Tax=Frankia sp. Cppng1_Ct_nod TaxID=2897162 RepID=UPI001041025A|nr:helix-turn-helix transcriptional regulator [Frankia sp. Cppng1_Ct_nod]